MEELSGKLAVIGLGYVGLPLAVAFSRVLPVIGYDTDCGKIARCQNGVDPTREVGDAVLAACRVDFTCDAARLREASRFVVAVPTPVRQDETPDLSPIRKASRTVGAALRRGALVIFESTVYPGATERVCVPLLEEASGLRCGADFKVGYSPERLNPGDRLHRLENIPKIVSGCDDEALALVAGLYGQIVEAGVHPVNSIKTAEAVKVAENSQRDVNIAFVNELALAFDGMGLDTQEVLAAMNTKWNALGFTPGLVGGHCIGVDPYYFLYEARRLGQRARLIDLGRQVNNAMAPYVADRAIRMLIAARCAVHCARVVILGAAFKENCPDTRNSKVSDIVRQLEGCGVAPQIVDPVADPRELRACYGGRVRALCGVRGADCVILAVAHDRFRNMTLDEIDRLCGDGARVVVDVKGAWPKRALQDAGYHYWRL